MMLALDVGNTNTVVGGFVDGALKFSLRMTSDRNKTVDEYVFQLRGLLEEKGVDFNKVEGGIISSVVPELRYSLSKSMEILTGKKFLVVTNKMDLGMEIKMDIPAQVGADLLVAAVAALDMCNPPLVIFDMGTATTMSVVDKDGSYTGGVIIPGLRLSMDALSGRAAQLPFINLEEPPERLIGKNTIDCMKAGAIYSNAAMIDGLIDRAEEEMGERVTAVATGGLMGIVLPFCKHKIYYDENLLLMGLLKLYEKNKH